MRQLLETGKVERGFLGVNLDANFDSQSATLVGLTQLRGARIKSVNPGSPAAEAGLQENDVIIQLDGLDVQNDQHLINLVKRTEIGQEVGVVVFRDRQSVDAKVRIGRRADYINSNEQQ
jgi:serine protease Do